LFIAVTTNHKKLELSDFGLAREETVTSLMTDEARIS
jgi:hypothetical protein